MEASRFNLTLHQRTGYPEIILDGDDDIINPIQHTFELRREDFCGDELCEDNHDELIGTLKVEEFHIGATPWRWDEFLDPYSGDLHTIGCVLDQLDTDLFSGSFFYIEHLEIDQKYTGKRMGEKLVKAAIERLSRTNLEIFALIACPRRLRTGEEAQLLAHYEPEYQVLRDHLVRYYQQMGFGFHLLDDEAVMVFDLGLVDLALPSKEKA